MCHCAFFGTQKMSMRFYTARVFFLGFLFGCQAIYCIRRLPLLCLSGTDASYLTSCEYMLLFCIFQGNFICLIPSAYLIRDRLSVWYEAAYRFDMIGLCVICINHFGLL